MAGPNVVASASPPLQPDALLVERIAALGDRTALAELDARHSMTLYAIALMLTLDSNVADAAVAATFREVWRSAASYNARATTVQRWLADLARRAVQDEMGRTAKTLEPLRPAPAVSTDSRPRPAPAAPRRRQRGGLRRLVRVSALFLLPALLWR